MASNLYMVHQFIKNTDALKIYINKLNVNNKLTEPEKVKERISDSLEKLLQQLRDIRLSIESTKVLNDNLTMLSLIKQQLSTADTLEKLIELGPLVEMINLRDMDLLSVYHLTSDADNHYYDNTSVGTIPESIMQNIRITMNANSLNIFHVECRDCKTIEKFAMEHDRTFGITNFTRSNYESLKEKMTRLIKGTLKGSHITNNFFDVVIVTPYVEYRHKTDSFNKTIEPNEKVEIRNCIKYLRQGGVYIIKVPVTRVDANLALWLSKVLSDNTQIIKIPDSSLDEVVIIGQKQITQKPKQELYNKLKYIDDEDIVLSDDINTSFVIPTEELTLDFFRGSSFDVNDVLEAADTHLINTFLESQTDPLVVKDQSPLLPFNIGQVGLVLTSGCLDGVVEEIDGVYHIIKGMTTKITTTKTEVSEETQQIKSTETIKNQVKINVFTANGEFISLS